MVSFLDSVINQLLQQGWEQLNRYTLIFPMQRASLYAKRALAIRLQQSGLTQPVLLPRMLTIDQLVDHLCPLQQEDEIRSIVRLYHCYQNRVSNDLQLDLDAFYGWGRQLLSDFNAIDMAMLDAKRVITNTAEAWQLDELDLDEETKERLQSLLNMNGDEHSAQSFYHHLWAALPSIYQDFSDQQKNNHLGTKGQCYQWVIQHYDELQPQLENRTYAFVGFNYLLPAERHLMMHFQKAQQAIFFWDYDPTFRVDTHVYEFIQANIQQFGNAITAPALASSQAPIDIVATVSSNAQSQYVAQWLDQYHHDGQHSAIVIADESMLESVLYALPDKWSGKVNITKGYPLKNTQIYARVVAFLSNKENDCTSGESYQGVLRRLVQYVETQLPDWNANQQEQSWRDILLSESLSQVLLVLRRFEVLFAEGVLADIHHLRTLRNLIRRCLDSITIPFHGEPVEEIQIIGVLETRLLDFDNVLILNVEDGIVPGASTDRSYIPFDIRRGYGMQTQEEETKIYAYNFFRLLRRSCHRTLLFSEAAGALQKKTMSRFIMQILLSDWPVQRKRITESAVVDSPKAIIPNQQWIRRAQTLPDGQKRLTISPSAISTYIECPRQFYLKYVLNLKDSENDTLIFESNQIGTLIHGTIKAIYEQISGGEILRETAVSKEQINAYLHASNSEEQIQTAIQQAYKAMNADYHKFHPEWPKDKDKYICANHPAENEVAKTVACDILRYDAVHTTNLRLCLLEQKHAHAISIASTAQQPHLNAIVEISGQIDRLDIVCEKGQDYLRVLDYKTGTYQSEKMAADDIATLFKDKDKRYVLQAMLYAMICAHSNLNAHSLPIMPQLLFTRNLAGDTHLKIAKQVISNYCDMDFEPELIQLLTNMLDDSEFKQCDEKVCSSNHYCPFHTLCGRSEG